MQRQSWRIISDWADDLEEQAARLRAESDKMRCPERESGGGQCGADRYPEHRHWMAPEDMPC